MSTGTLHVKITPDISHMIGDLERLVETAARTSTTLRLSYSSHASRSRYRYAGQPRKLATQLRQRDRRAARRARRAASR